MSRSTNIGNVFQCLIFDVDLIILSAAGIKYLGARAIYFLFTRVISDFVERIRSYYVTRDNIFRFTVFSPFFLENKRTFSSTFIFIILLRPFFITAIEAFCYIASTLSHVRPESHKPFEPIHHSYDMPRY